MGKSIQERCDKVIGQSGDFFMSIAGYKEKPEDTENRYKFGVYFDYPAVVKDLPEGDLKKIAIIGVHRVVSVSQAPFKAKLEKGEMGEADIEAWAKEFSGDGFLVKLNEVKERATGGGAGKADSFETKVIKKIDAVLRKKVADGSLAAAKVAVPRADDPPKTEKGQINFNQWAKVLRQEKHPWAEMAQKLVEKEMASIDKQYE